VLGFLVGIPDVQRFCRLDFTEVPLLPVAPNTLTLKKRGLKELENPQSSRRQRRHMNTIQNMYKCATKKIPVTLFGIGGTYFIAKTDEKKK